MVYRPIFSLLALSSTAFARNRTFTVVNQCKETIWPAIFTDLNVGNAVPYGAPDLAGWEAKPNSIKSFMVPDNWRAGRIWARTGCDFSKGSGPTTCDTGSCIGVLNDTTNLHCDPHVGTGGPPATLAEFTFGKISDFYDVSLVDGFNLPLKISLPNFGARRNSTSCGSAGCNADLNPKCPKTHQVLNKTTQKVAGCKSDCLMSIDRENSPSCCSGDNYKTLEKCPSSGVPNYDYFKQGCKRSYAYAYDEPSGTSLFTCPNEEHADYQITFCPDEEI